MDLKVKFRPTTFDGVIGQAAAVRSIRNTLEKKQSKAFLLHGPPGTGKTTLARIIAQEVGCDKRNLNEINGADATGVDAMREVATSMMYAGLGTPAKVTIVDECQRLTAQAWSVLLKPVEEPSKHAYWIFCTTDPAKVPKAILTRCTQYETKPVAIESLFDLLMGVAKAEKMDTPEDVIYAVAEKSDGSPRLALSNLARCATCKDRKSAARMLKEIQVDGDPAIIEIARGIQKENMSWAAAMKLLKDVGDKANAEGHRQVMINYFLKIAMDASGDRAKSAIAVLDAFARPYPPSSNLYPVVLSLADLLL